MLKLALWGLVIVAATGILVAAILILARLVVGLILVIVFVGAIWLCLKLLYRALTKGCRAKGASDTTAAP